VADASVSSAHRLQSFASLREAATSERVPPAAWLAAGLTRALVAVLAAPRDAAASEASAPVRHAAVWLLVELTASDAEGTVELATALAADACPLLIPFLDGPDTVMAEMCAHGLANVMASSPALPAALGRMGAAAALCRQLQRLPSSLAGRCMWAVRQFLLRPEISHAPVLEAAMPAVAFWLGKAQRGAADEDAAAADGTAAAAPTGLRGAVVEAAMLLSTVAQSAHEAWPALLAPAASPLPAACAVLLRPSLHPVVRVRLLEAVACASWAVDAGPLLLSQPGFGAALVAMAATGAPEVNAEGRPTGRGLTGGAIEARAMSPTSDVTAAEELGTTPTSTAHFGLTIAANAVSGCDPDVGAGLESRRLALAAAGAAAALPSIAALAAPAEAGTAAAPSAGRRAAAMAASLIGAGLHAVCARWLHSSARMRLDAIKTVSALALAGSEAGGPAPHLAAVTSVPGVLPALVEGVGSLRSVEECGRCLGVVRAGLTHLGAGFAEAAEGCGLREAMDELGYSRYSGTDGPWGHMAREARRLVDAYLEEEEDDDDEEEGAGAAAGHPFGAAAAAASAGPGTGRAGLSLRPAWQTAPGAASPFG